MSRQKVMIFVVGFQFLLFFGCHVGSADTALTGAASRGDTAQIQLLLDRGTDVNEKNGRGLTALMCAARDGKTEAMEILLERGAAIDVRDAGPNGWTALVHAIHKNQNQAAHLLLEQGADANARADGGATPLMYAAGYDNAAIVEELLARGADPRAAAGGATVLSNAVGGAWDIDRMTADRCPTDTVRALMERAPDLKLPKNFEGRAAAFFAKRRGCSELVTLLEQRPQGG